MGRPKLTEEQRIESIEKRKAYQHEYYKKKYYENIEESRRKSREQLKQWRRENPEKYAAIQIRHLEKIINSFTTEVQ